MGGRIDQSVKLVEGKHDPIIHALNERPLGMSKQEWFINALLFYVENKDNNTPPQPPHSPPMPPQPFDPSGIAASLREGLVAGFKELVPVFQSAMLPYRGNGNFSRNEFYEVSVPDDMPSLSLETAGYNAAETAAARDAVALSMGAMFDD